MPTETMHTTVPSRSHAEERALWRQGRDRFGTSWVGRRVMVVGLGKSGIAAAILLRRVGAVVSVTETSNTERTRAAQRELVALGITDCELGQHTRHGMEHNDVLVVSPGVPDDAAPIQWAQQAGCPILSEIELAFLFCDGRIVAITGTNGKSTTVTMAAQVLRAAGRDAIACGNLGQPFASIVESVTRNTVVVLEVSSFQLTWCHRFRPDTGVLLNIGTNHLDRHRNRQAYRAAKVRLFAQQTPQDWALLNGSDPDLVALSKRLQAQVVWFSRDLGNPDGMRLAAQTLRSVSEGAQAVLQIGRLMGIPDPLTWQVIRTFRGLEHRLEPVGSVRGIRFINDSKSTTPDSLLYALAQTRGSLVVIAGGRDKGLDFRAVGQALGDARIRGVVLIGEARAHLRACCHGHPGMREVASVDDAVTTALELAESGTTVLFSPGCASFDMFRNFEARGRAFKRTVSRLVDGSENFHHLPENGESPRVHAGL